MRSIPAGEFKQRCLRILDEVRESGETIVITRRGVPVAHLGPLEAKARGDFRDAMRGTGRIVGDLVAPATEPREWRAL